MAKLFRTSFVWAPSADTGTCKFEADWDMLEEANGSFASCSGNGTHPWIILISYDIWHSWSPFEYPIPPTSRWSCGESLYSRESYTKFARLAIWTFEPRESGTLRSKHCGFNKASIYFTEKDLIAQLHKIGLWGSVRHKAVGSNHRYFAAGIAFFFLISHIRAAECCAHIENDTGMLSGSLQPRIANLSLFATPGVATAGRQPLYLTETTIAFTAICEGKGEMQ